MKRRFVTLSLWIFIGFLFGNLASAASSTSDVMGYAWSSNLGWVSFNCKNVNSCASVDYGVTYDKDTGNLDGYAWSSNVGWISFKLADLSGCPQGSCQSKVTGGKLTGWARVLSGKVQGSNPEQGWGWDGWIHLSNSASGYEVTFDGTKFAGYSWSYQEGVPTSGYWFKWNPSQGPGVYTIAKVDLTTGIVTGGTASSVLVQTDNCKLPTCIFTYEANKVVDLLATPAPGYYFKNWTGADAGRCSNPTSALCYNVTLDSDKIIKAEFRTANCPTDGPGNCPVCYDDVDNDTDSKKDYGTSPNNDPDCKSKDGTSESPPNTVHACSDCLDNDKDGKIDWLNDNGCTGSNDDNETNAKLTVSVLLQDPQAKGKVISINHPSISCEPNCTKEFINDENVNLTAISQAGNPVTTFVGWQGDCSGSVPTCVVKMDKDRDAIAIFTTSSIPACPSSDPVAGCPTCNDILDNDGKYGADWQVDPSCHGDPNETEGGTGNANCPGAGPGICPQCNDGIDNDGGDGPDYGVDPQCVSYDDNSEGVGPDCPMDGPGKCPQCYDGIDNTDPEDNIPDYPNDPGCYNRSDNSEIDPIITNNCPFEPPTLNTKCSACNDGVDNDGDGKTDWGGYDADKDGIKEIPADPSCQGQPDKNTESGSFIEVEV
ncbi:MAG TPA: hypothetical protein VJJ22_04210 [Candidatus Paceibacterota bacterium]